MTVDVHSLAAFQNSFRIPVDNLDTTRLFTEKLVDFLDISLADDLVILSPDVGGIARTSLIQRALIHKIHDKTGHSPLIRMAVFDKRRINGKVEGSRIIGDVANLNVLVFDDLISSGSTISKAVSAVEKADGKVLAVCATHGQFTKGAKENLAGVKHIFVTDTIAQTDDFSGSLEVISTTKLLAEAILTNYQHGSISDLLAC